jgi:hypothetical protein
MENLKWKIDEIKTEKEFEVMKGLEKNVKINLWEQLYQEMMQVARIKQDFAFFKF